MHPLHHVRDLLLICAAASSLGCAANGPLGASTPSYDRQFGAAVRHAKAAQTLDPQASSRNAGQTSSIDAEAAANSIDRYRDSFKTPPANQSGFGILIPGVGN